MSTAFYRGQELGTKDLDICLDNAAGHPTNVAEITYALYDVTTGQEALLGVPRRNPANDSVGHYFASIVIPLDANVGCYRVRWTFREMVGGPVHQVVQEFNVIDKATEGSGGGGTCFTACESDLIRRLRIMLR